MKINVIVGCEGMLGKQIVAAKLSNTENVVIGYDMISVSNFTHDRFHFVSGSVENRSEIAGLRDKIKEVQLRYGSGSTLDCIINSFAASEYKYEKSEIPEEIPETDWMLWGWQNYPDQDFIKQYDINVVGIHRVLTTLYDSYKDSQSCSIVNFSSQFAKRNLDQVIFRNLGHYIFKPPAYSASKAALENYTQYLSQLFKGTGIRVNSIAPGIVFSGQSEAFTEKYSLTTNSGRLMNPKEIVGAIDFLTSEDSSYMNGACLTIDGGWSVR